MFCHVTWYLFSLQHFHLASLCLLAMLSLRPSSSKNCSLVTLPHFLPGYWPISILVIQFKWQIFTVYKRIIPQQGIFSIEVPTSKMSLACVKLKWELDRCGGLKENDPPKGSGTIRRCGFVGVGEALLEEVCHYGSGLWCLIYAQAIPSVSDHFLLLWVRM